MVGPSSTSSFPNVYAHSFLEKSIKTEGEKRKERNLLGNGGPEGRQTSAAVKRKDECVPIRCRI